MSGEPRVRRRPRARVAVGIAGALAVATSGALGALPATAAPATGTRLTFFAGDGSSDAVTPGPATSSPVHNPSTLATDGAGNVFASFGSLSPDQYSVAKINTTGTISYLLNSSRMNGTATIGAAVSSSFGRVSGIAADAAGNVYVGDITSKKVFTIDTSGQLSLLAGNGSVGTLVPGAATSASFIPGHLAVGPDGSVYVATTYRQVARISTSGQLTVVAGTGVTGYVTPGTAGSPVAATASPFFTIAGLAVDGSGNLFISEQTSHCVTRVGTDGNLTTVLGRCGTSGGFVAGAALDSRLNSPRQVAVDRFGALYVVDKSNRRVEKVTSPASGAGTVESVAGDGIAASLAEGAAASSGAGYVTGVAVDRALNVFLAEGGSARIAKVAAASSAPDAPTALGATAGQDSVHLTFTAPAEDGGTPVSGYEGSLDGGLTWQALTTSGTGPITATLSGLAAGTTYTVAVRAVNSVGSGTASATVTAATPPAPTPTPTETTTDTPTPTDTTTSSSTTSTSATTSSSTTTGSTTTSSTTTGSTTTGSTTTTATMTTSGPTTAPTVTATRTSSPTAGPTSTPPPTPTPTRTTSSPPAPPAPPAPPKPPAPPAVKGLIPVPPDPPAYSGPKKVTEALNRSFTGAPATPITKLSEPLEVGEAAVLSDAGLFPFNSAKLSAKGLAEVKLLAAQITDGGGVRCEGYTDYAGQAAHQNTLSRRRSAAVCAALVAAGARVTYTTVGYGGKRPVVVGGTPRSRAQNRRVVVVITR